MAIILDVPMVQQQQSNQCWYAAACMLSYYRKPGPLQDLQGRVENNIGLGSSLFIDLAMQEGLLPVLNPGREWTVKNLEDELRQCGPLWCAGRWQGLPHIIVVTGVDENLSKPVIINDPGYSTSKNAQIEWFNLKLDKHVSNCMLYLPNYQFIPLRRGGKTYV